MKNDREDSRQNVLATSFVSLLETHSVFVIIIFILITIGMGYPLIWMNPAETASPEPAGPIFEANQLAAERFASDVYRMVFLVEARDGNLLDQAPLAELLENTRKLRKDRQLGSKLIEFPDPVTGQKVKGVTTLSDLVESKLTEAGIGSLPDASAKQVALTVGNILSSVPFEKFGLSEKTKPDPLGMTWRSPAMLVVVFADNELLGGGGQSTMLGKGDTSKEQFARKVLTVLRGAEQHYRAWGVATDVNLTSQEQGKAAGPYIGLTIFAALILVGFLMRSYWSVAVVGFSLGTLMIWLKGFSNLVGLKQDLILETIVPIAMISFGVDFAFHSLGRYKENAKRDRKPSAVFRIGLAGVLGSLLLAMATDSAAFLSNLSAGIESLTQFGIAAAMATVASFALLGVFSPILIMRIEQRVGSIFCSRSRKMLLLEMFCSIPAALCSMLIVILIVFLDPRLGFLLLLLFGFVFMLAPAFLLSRFYKTDSTRLGSMNSDKSYEEGQLPWLGNLVATVSRFKLLVLLPAFAITVLSVILSLRIDAQFDVKDFFSPRSDFVMGLSSFDEHFGKTSGEPAFIYLEGPFNRPEAIKALRAFRKKLQALDTDTLAKKPDGTLHLRSGLLEMLDMAGPGALSENPKQISACYQNALAKGLKDENSNLVMTADEAKSMLFVSEDGNQIATTFQVRIPGSRSNESLALARAAVEPLADDLQRELKDLDSTSKAIFTGQPITRHASLDAILKAFRISLLIAVFSCLLLATLFMRSLRYGFVCVVPILLVVSWLYAFMYLAGFPINVVTATIGAISIGVGIDFAVHLTMRYREELAGKLSSEEALFKAGAGTGSAILGAGFTSIVGFSILAFAPMPMFASFGLLTAVMIALAIIASLFVLPALLALVTPGADKNN